MNWDTPGSKGPQEAVEHITVIKVSTGETATTQASLQDSEAQCGRGHAEEQAHLAASYQE